MGRYRAPSKPSTALISPAGAQRLRGELQHLWREERPRVAKAVQDAAKNGDRSENGDYIYGKKRLREIDGRVRHISKRLEVLTVVEHRPADQGRVYFGATVDYEDEEGLRRSVTILGPDEFDALRDEISIDAPLARALLGKSKGEWVSFSTPHGDREVEITDVRYCEFSEAKEDV
ncbi:MAG: transcription elongation factor GreB [Pseudomonadota bacterium]